MTKPKPTQNNGDKQPTPEEIPQHIIIIPQTSESGELVISVQANGFSLVELPTLLALAKKQVEEKLGI